MSGFGRVTMCASQLPRRSLVARWFDDTALAWSTISLSPVARHARRRHALRACAAAALRPGAAGVGDIAQSQRANIIADDFGWSICVSPTASSAPVERLVGADRGHQGAGDRRLAGRALPQRQRLRPQMANKQACGDPAAAKPSSVHRTALGIRGELDPAEARAISRQHSTR